MGGAGDVIVKRMTLTGTLLTSTAGGVISTTLFPTSQVESAPAHEWASFAARYQQYRVRAIRLSGKAVLPVNTATVIHGALFMADYIGSSSPSSAAQVFSDERGKCVATCKDFVYEADWSRNPNAKLWNPTSAAVPTANLFGIAVASDASQTLSVSTTYYVVEQEFVVELRGSQ